MSDQDARSAAHTPAELQKRIDALLDEGLTTDEILARLEADDRSAATTRTKGGRR